MHFPGCVRMWVCVSMRVCVRMWVWACAWVGGCTPVGVSTCVYGYAHVWVVVGGGAYNLGWN